MNVIRNTEGASALSYSLIAALVAVSLAGGATALGKRSNAMIDCTEVMVRKGEKIKKPEKRFKRCVKRRG